MWSDSGPACTQRISSSLLLLNHGLEGSTAVQLEQLGDPERGAYCASSFLYKRASTEVDVTTTNVHLSDLRTTDERSAKCGINGPFRVFAGSVGEDREEVPSGYFDPKAPFESGHCVQRLVPRLNDLHPIPRPMQSESSIIEASREVVDSLPRDVRAFLRPVCRGTSVAPATHECAGSDSHKRGGESHQGSYELPASLSHQWPAGSASLPRVKSEGRTCDASAVCSRSRDDHGPDDVPAERRVLRGGRPGERGQFSRTNQPAFYAGQAARSAVGAIPSLTLRLALGLK